MCQGLTEKKVTVNETAIVPVHQCFMEVWFKLWCAESLNTYVPCSSETHSHCRLPPTLALQGGDPSEMHTAVLSSPSPVGDEGVHLTECWVYTQDRNTVSYYPNICNTMSTHTHVHMYACTHLKSTMTLQ